MLWLCLYIPRLPLQWRHSELQELTERYPDAPLAVMESSMTKPRLIACSDHCKKHGIIPGLDVASALSSCPTLRLLPRSLHQEKSSLETLAAWAGRFSSFTSFDAERLLLWLEVGASLKYFDGLDSLVDRVQRDLVERQYDAQVGIAPTLEAAALLAQLGGQPPAFPDDLHHRLAVLPSRILPLPGAVIGSLQASGLMTIGQVLSVPAEALVRRFGQDTVDGLHRLLGTSPDIRVQFRPPDIYRRQMDLAGWGDSGEDFLPLLRRILDGLEEFLWARDVGVRRLMLFFQHEGRSPTRMTFRVSRPLRKATHLHRLLRYRLERSVFAAPVVAMSLEASELVAMEDVQPALLGSGGGRRGDWPGLFDKLRARLGDAAVRRLGVRDDYRPECAWCFVEDDSIGVYAPAADRPLWLLDRRPLGVLPEDLGAPERIEAGWWDGRDIARDYYRARAVSGSQMWLYRDRKSLQWYLHGLWA